jgi:SAM-dependent methyltransferase
MRKESPLPKDLWDQVSPDIQTGIWGLVDKFEQHLAASEAEVAELQRQLAQALRKDGEREESRYGLIHPATNGPVRFPEHGLAHQLLDGLRGLEIGAAAHNPFGLNARNVTPREDYEFYAAESRKLGGEPAPVGIFAFGDDIPVPSVSEDFILSSHVVEHLPNVIDAFVEWNRIVRDGGYVFMIVPLKGALPADGSRELTPLEHIIADYGNGATVDTHPIDKVPGGRMGHYHTFTPDSLLALVEWMKTAGLCDWDLVAREDVDTKVGNGFTLAFRVRHQNNTRTHQPQAPI